MGKTNKAHKTITAAEKVTKSIHTKKSHKAEEQATRNDVREPEVVECVNCGSPVIAEGEDKCNDCLIDQAFMQANKTGVKIDIPSDSAVATVLAEQDKRHPMYESASEVDAPIGVPATIESVVVISAEGVIEQASITGDVIETLPEVLPEVTDTPAEAEPVLQGSVTVLPVDEPETLEARIARLEAEKPTTAVTKTDKPKGAKYVPVVAQKLPDIGVTIGGVFALALEAAGRAEGVTYPEIKTIWREHKYASTNTALEDLLERRLMLESDMTPSRKVILNKRCAMLAGSERPFESSLPGISEQLVYPKYCTVLDGVREGKKVYRLFNIEAQEVVVL